MKPTAFVQISATHSNYRSSSTLHRPTDPQLPNGTIPSTTCAVGKSPIRIHRQKTVKYRRVADTDTDNLSKFVVPNFLGASAKLREETIGFVMSVYMENLGYLWIDIHEIYISLFFENLSRISKFDYNLTRITGTLHE
jgi:hypothetical protein